MTVLMNTPDLPASPPGGNKPTQPQVLANEAALLYHYKPAHNMF